MAGKNVISETFCERFVANREQIYHNGIVYTFPDGSAQIIAADRLMFREPGWEMEGKDGGKPRPGARKSGTKSTGEDRERSARRARSKLRRLALSNDFQFFVTLTLAPDRVDRYDSGAIMKIVNRWLDNMVRRHGLRYILVPERHKDGAFHFHGFFAGAGVQVVDSGHQIGGRTAYNLPQWTLGFSTAQELYGDYHAAVAYCCKYIGKQDGERPMGRWYYSGGGLREPQKMYVDLDFDSIDNAAEFEVPAAKMKVLTMKGAENHD